MSTAIFRDEPLGYTATQLNNVASVLLSDLVATGEVDEETAILAKQIFNTVIDLALNYKEQCDCILEEAAKWDAEIKNMKDFDIMEAANKVVMSTLEKDNQGSDDGNNYVS